MARKLEEEKKKAGELTAFIDDGQSDDTLFTYIYFNWFKSHRFLCGKSNKPVKYLPEVLYILIREACQFNFFALDVKDCDLYWFNRLFKLPIVLI